MTNERPAAPRVSVIINTAGRRRTLPATLDALRRQTVPHEIVVVVGPVDDGAKALLAAMPDIKTRQVDELNLSASRNEGIRASAGDIIAFVDDDAIPEPTWLAELLAVYERLGAECGAVGGAVINEQSPDHELQFRFGRIDRFGRTDDVRLEPNDDDAWFSRLMGANMSFRREALEAVGGFDERFVFQHEETDICVRIIRAGWRVVPIGGAVVLHYPATSHNRRNGYDLNWYRLLYSNAYFALKHSGAGVLMVAWILARRFAFLLKRYATWTMRGRITPWDAVRFTSQWFGGFIAGLRAGVKRLRQGDARGDLKENDSSDFAPIEMTLPDEKAWASFHRPLRLGLCSNEFGSEGAGGVATYTLHLARALSARGNDVVVFRSGKTRCHIKEAGFDVVDVSPAREIATSYPTALLDAVRGASERFGLVGFDVIEAPLWSGEASALGVARVAPIVLRLETPSAIVNQISAATDRGALMSEAMERLSLSYATGVIAISQAIARKVEAVYGARLETPSRRAAVIPLGLPDVAEIPLARTAAPRGDGPCFLFVGRLEARKGILELADAFARVIQKSPSAALWIAGEDNSAHDGFANANGRGYQDHIVDRLGQDVAGRVRFFGKVTEAVKNRLIAQCDVVVMPSLYESFGLVLLEAMRLGRPLVATHVGGIPEVVEDGVCSLLVPPQSSADLAIAMERLGADASLRRRLGAAARARFETDFLIDRCAERTERFYRDLLDVYHRDRRHEVEDLTDLCHAGAA